MEWFAPTRSDGRHGVQPFKSEDPDSERVWWDDAGVHQNLTFAPHPDPVSGSHAWHQKVRVERAHEDDEYGTIFVDTNRSFEIYQEWLKLAHPAPGPNNQRRPQWPADGRFPWREDRDHLLCVR